MNLNKKQAEFATIYVNNPDMTLVDISKEIGVHRNTITNWLSDKEFVESLYQTYMQSFGAKLPSVLQSMYKEAINGNVQAGRLILEHSGKLIKNVEVKVESPFERFLEGHRKIENVIEVEEDITELLGENKESPIEKLNKQKSESKKLLSRAKKVGLKPLGPGRHTKTKRKEWLQKLEKLEEKNS
tara:strand:+ start:8271 stop:8825 length:555 start_codon:yes stop_codon:yes gene_type:complete